MYLIGELSPITLFFFQLADLLKNVTTLLVHTH